MATLRPWSRSSRANFSTTGVLPGAAHGQVADGDDLHPQRRVAQDADVVEQAAGLDGDLEDLGAGRGAAPARALSRVPRRSSTITSRPKVSSFSVHARSLSRIWGQSAKPISPGQAEGGKAEMLKC